MNLCQARVGARAEKEPRYEPNAILNILDFGPSKRNIVTRMQREDPISTNNEGAQFVKMRNRKVLTPAES